MNSGQWTTFAIGLFILSLLLWSSAFGWKGACSGITTGDAFCAVKEQSYAIPAIFSTILSVIFFICAGLESKKKD